MLSAEHAVVAAMLICVGGAGLAIPLGRRQRLAGWLAFALVLLSSLLVLAGAARVLMTGPGRAVTFLAVPSIGFALRIYVDGLSALFLGLIATVAIPSFLYSIEYMAHHQEHGVGRYYPNFLLFVAAMYGLVSTTDMMYFFFIFWQMMTLAGWGLIRYERRKPENERAAAKYLVMMQLACGATMLGAGLLARGGVSTPAGETLMPYDFDAVSHHLPERLATEGPWVALAFALFLVGFGIKLGMWPFGRIWLPDAHPAAPSPVSAMLSGVMIKTGVYGLMRYFLWLVPEEGRSEFPVGAWGVAIALLGTVTLFTGTLEALRQNQTKRLLAFSSIGQGGYILLGLGVCLSLLTSKGEAGATLAAAGFYGALFHTLNHGVFKSLLFLNAGSVLHATGTQDLNKLGGLLRLMPWTAVTALVGSLAIAGVPLLSGFASKWSIYTAALQPEPAGALLPLCAVVAILTSAMTLVLVMKFFGAAFLSRTSALVASHASARARMEVGWKMRSAQVTLAGLCVAIGFFPLLVTTLLTRGLASSRQGFGDVLANAAPIRPLGWAGLGGLNQQAVYEPLAVAMLLGGLFLFVRWLASLGGTVRRSAAPWLCGYAREAEVHRYGARHFLGEMGRALFSVRRSPRPVAVEEPTGQAAGEAAPTSSIVSPS